MTVPTAIIDDHEAIRVGMGAAFAATADHPVLIVDSAATVSEFLALDSEATVVVLDLRLDDESDPKENVERLIEVGYRVVVYSIADNTRMLRQALAGGADAVCRKAEPIADTIQTIINVAKGRPELTQEILSAIEGDTDYVAASLGAREREVLSLYAAGLEVHDVARTLYITENSVKEYLKRIRAKYTSVNRPATSKLELFKRAIEDGIVPPVEPLA